MSAFSESIFLVIQAQAPTVGTFAPNNVTVGTSLGDRAPPVAAMVGIVSPPNPNCYG